MPTVASLTSSGLPPDRASLTDVGFFLINYVIDGGVVTLNVTRNDTIDVSMLVVSLDDEVSEYPATNFKTKIANTTYYLDFTANDREYSWSTSHAAGVSGTDYLPIAEVTTNSNKNVSVITDKRGDTAGFRLKPGYMYPEIAALQADAMQRAINIKQPPYNATGGNVTDDTTVIQAAFNAITEGIIYFPPGTYKVTSKLTLSASNVRLVFSPHAIISTSIYLTTALQLDGNNVTVEGATINSPAQWDPSNTYTGYGVIHTIGSNVTIRDCTLNNIYKIGIAIKGGQNILVQSNRLHGNIPENTTPNNPGHFGIEYDADVAPNGNVLIQGNFIDTCVQGVFISERGGTLGYGINISGNSFTSCYNHGVYANGGYGNVINNNSFRQCQIAVAAYGNYASIQDNTLYTSDLTDSVTSIVGISVREPIGCIIKGNIIKGNVVDNTVIINLTNLSADPSPHNFIIRNIVEGNIIEIASGNAISINLGDSSLTQVCNNNIIRNNIIKAPCRNSTGIINIFTASGYIGYDNDISGNKITYINDPVNLGQGEAIQVQNQKYCNIKDNTIRFEFNWASSVILFGILTVSSSYVTVESNQILCDANNGTNVNIRALRDSGSDRIFYKNNLVSIDTTKATYTALDIGATNMTVYRNMISSDPLSGTAALTGSSLAVANKNVSSYSKVLLVPKNVSAATVMKNQGYYITISGGTGFTLFTGDAAAPGSQADFDYVVI